MYIWRGHIGVPWIRPKPKVPPILGHGKAKARTRANTQIEWIAFGRGMALGQNRKFRGLRYDPERCVEPSFLTVLDSLLRRTGSSMRRDVSLCQSWVQRTCVAVCVPVRVCMQYADHKRCCRWVLSCLHFEPILNTRLLQHSLTSNNSAFYNFVQTRRFAYICVIWCT